MKTAIDKSRWRGASAAVVTVCLFAGALIAAGYWIPLGIRASYRFQINYSEGYALYEEVRAAGGQLYSAPPGYVADGYPPLFFYVVNGMAHVLGDPLIAGRLVATIGLALTAVFLGATVFVMTRDWAAAIIGLLLLLVSVARCAPDYAGVHDPQFVADGILLVGVFLFFARATPRFTVLSAILVATALFFKHSAVSFPVAILLVLAIKDRGRALVWTGWLAVATAAWIGFCYLAQGKYLVENLLAPRAVKSAMVTAALFLHVGKTIVLPLIATGLWLLIDRANLYRPYVAAAIGMACAYGLWITRYEGAWVNHWFDLILAVSIGACLAWARLRGFWIETGRRREWLLGLFPLVVLVGDAVAMPRDIVSLAEAKKAWAAEEAQFQADAEYLRNRPGGAICENLSICYFAGKHRDYDPYVARQRILGVPGGAETIVEALRAHRYSTVQIDAERGDPLAATNRLRFPAVFMQALLENYHVDRRGDERAFFVPNGPATGQARDE